MLSHKGRQMLVFFAFAILYSFGEYAHHMNIEKNTICVSEIIKHHVKNAEGRGQTSTQMVSALSPFAMLVAVQNCVAVMKPLKTIYTVSCNRTHA
jgi:hypothetical protein